jgi:hypothetical protein
MKPLRQEKKPESYPDFTLTRQEWETNVFLNAKAFRVHRFYSNGRREDFETPDFEEALKSVGREMKIGRQALIYAIDVSNRSVCLPKTEYKMLYELWLRRET